MHDTQTISLPPEVQLHCDAIAYTFSSGKRCNRPEVREYADRVFAPLMVHESGDGRHAPTLKNCPQCGHLWCKQPGSEACKIRFNVGQKCFQQPFDLAGYTRDMAEAHRLEVGNIEIIEPTPKPAEPTPDATPIEQGEDIAVCPVCSQPIFEPGHACHGRDAA